jgi:hypothetical protein
VQLRALWRRSRRRPLRRARIAAAVLLATLVVALPLSQAAGADESLDSLLRPAAGVALARAPSPTPVLSGTGIIRWGSSYPTAAGYDRYSYVLVSTHYAEAAARLPGKSIAYMSGTSIQRKWSTGVTYEDALANGWLLKDASGQYVMNVQYRAYVADIGDPAYQQRFIANMIDFLRATKADGVFIDDVIAHPAVLTRNSFPAKYPTGDAWESAMVSFVTTVGSALKQRGYYVLVNAVKYIKGDTRSDTGELTAAFWRRIAPGVSGLMSEFWLQNPTDIVQLRSLGTLWHQNWGGWQSLVSVAQGAGADFFALTYGSAGDRRAMRFLRGSFLLDWNGRGGALIYETRDRSDPYDRAWVRQVGRPLGPKVERAPGVWERRYTKAIVVVNATGARVSFRVAGRAWPIEPTDALLARPPRR